MKDKRTSGSMTGYKEHYQRCRELNPIEGGIYNSVYDLTVDSTLFGLDNGAYTDAYFNIIETIRNKIDDKIKRMSGCFKDSIGHAIRVNDWRDIKELYTLADYFMPIIEKNLNKYFKTIKENLVPGGRVAIQAIVIKDELHDRYRHNQDFIQKYIFPGGFLPSIKSLNKLSIQSDLKIENYQLYGQHYSSTLQEWKKSFFNSWNLISKQGFNTNFKRMWDFYLSYCEAGFKSKNIDLIQFSLCNK